MRAVSSATSRSSVEVSWTVVGEAQAGVARLA